MPISADYVKSKIDAARDALGRYVTFYTPIAGQDTDFTASGFYDPLHYTGFNPTLEETEVLARIHWAGDERITATPGGKYYIGDVTLGIDPTYHELAQKCMNAESGKVLVDGKYVTITAIDPWGAPSINRIKLRCKPIGTKPEA